MPTGAFHSILNYSRTLRDEFDFYYAVPKGCWTRLSEVQASRIFTFNFLELGKSIRIFWYLPQLIINTAKLSRIVRKQSIDVIHVNDLYNMLGICLKLVYPNTKVVYHVRLLRNSYAKALYNVWLGLISRYADQVISVSKRS